MTTKLSNMLNQFNFTFNQNAVILRDGRKYSLSLDGVNNLYTKNSQKELASLIETLVANNEMNLWKILRK